MHVCLHICIAMYIILCFWSWVLQDAVGTDAEVQTNSTFTIYTEFQAPMATVCKYLYSVHIGIQNMFDQVAAYIRSYVATMYVYTYTYSSYCI